MIEAFHLRAAERGVTLFSDLTLSFDEGEVWIVTGPPSSGKSLLLRILAGDRKPDSGDVLADGESLYGGSPGARSRFRQLSAFVPEALPADGRTVGDLFRLSALSAGKIPREERTRREEQLLGLLGVAGTREVLLRHLSVSERTRVALAAELFRGPKVLFLDTVLANAGKDWADSLTGLFRALAREGRTIVMLERDMPERLKAMVGPETWGDPEADTDPRIREAGPFLLFRLSHGDRKAPAGDPPDEPPGETPDESPRADGTASERPPEAGEEGEP